MSDPNNSTNSGQTGVQATLTFDLTDPEQRHRLQRMLAADDLCCVVWDVQQYLHELLDDDRTVPTIETIESTVYELLARWPHAWAVMEEWT